MSDAKPYTLPEWEADHHDMLNGGPARAERIRATVEALERAAPCCATRRLRVGCRCATPRNSTRIKEYRRNRHGVLACGRLTRYLFIHGRRTERRTKRRAQMNGTNETTNQAGWIAFDNAYRAARGGKKGERAGYAARAAVHAAGLIEGPAEHPTSFSARSSMRQLGYL